LTEDTVEFGGAILGAEAEGSPTGNGLVGVLRFVTTEDFSGTDLLISSHSLRSFGGEQEDVDAAILAHISAADDSGMEGDFDGDGQVGFSDFFRFADAFGQPDFDPRFDLDNDGQVGFGDFFRFADAFGQGVAKAVAAEALPQVDGQLLLAAHSVDGEVLVDLYSVDLQINGYATVVQYNAAAFDLVEVTDAASVLTTPLLLTRQGHGEVLIAGSATGSAESVEGVLVQLRFVSTTEEASGLFRMRQADGGLAEVGNWARRRFGRSHWILRYTPTIPILLILRRPFLSNWPKWSRSSWRFTMCWGRRYGRWQRACGLRASTR
jgi:hypothetical protein